MARNLYFYVVLNVLLSYVISLFHLGNQHSKVPNMVSRGSPSEFGICIKLCFRYVDSVIYDHIIELAISFEWETIFDV